jgi:hypothetical protein
MFPVNKQITMEQYESHETPATAMREFPGKDKLRIPMLVRKLKTQTNITPMQ